MIFIETVGEAVAELQFGNEFEEWKIKVASESYFHKSVVAFQLYYVLALCSEIERRVKSRYKIRSVAIRMCFSCLVWFPLDVPPRRWQKGF